MIINTQSFLLYIEIHRLSNSSDRKIRYFMKFVKICENQKKFKNIHKSHREAVDIFLIYFKMLDESQTFFVGK
ncbi:hypothetical protein EGX73_05205 [Enterococcus sp. FDAARGOS_553]|nr:hypothetical protein EGX73_05205 [Enterococcus sp. FDAARGOS_553]MBO6325768.1 hypothetical protein [Enterococcus gallinarum]RGC44575.1 hypothetical protein DXA88_14100 [Enterococcus gallinarum]ROY86277.1 hypothetical protein EGW76_12425 [Enterococcus gallinarum]TXT68280.1 hypothetical protein D4N12_12585 [Enterococcus gallinarum]